MMNLHKICLLAFSFFVLVSCDEDNKEPDNADSEPGVKITNNAEFGSILSDQDNQTLYFFANDISGGSSCNGGCAAVWPPLTGEAYDLDIAAGLNSDDFSSIVRQDGVKQITYKGWPLYYFSPEGDGVLETLGDVEGDGKNDVFYVAKPDYSLMVGKQSVEEEADAVIYLVDDRGVSLYLNTGDEENASNCAGGCAVVWPPFKSPDNLVLPSIVSATDVTYVDREDELGPQLAIFGSPLYYFSTDEQLRGNVLGQAGGPAKSFFVVGAK